MNPPFIADPIVQATDVTKIYRSRDLEVTALDSISLEVGRGEMVSVMGPSGCGKTTLLNCLSGLDSIDSGVVRIDGQVIADLADNALSEYRAKSMGFIFQSYNLLPVLSARENVELPLVLTGVRQSVAQRVAMEKLDLVGLADQAAHRPMEMSGGQQQRVTIARALANEPAIIWADEPSGNLDSVNENQVMDLLIRLNKEAGQTFIIVTHSDHVGDLTDRTIRMLDGNIIDYGTRAGDPSMDGAIPATAEAAAEISEPAAIPATA